MLGHFQTAVRIMNFSMTGYVQCSLVSVLSGRVYLHLAWRQYAVLAVLVEMNGGMLCIF